MSRFRTPLVASLLSSLVAAATVWVTLVPWGRLTADPEKTLVPLAVLAGLVGVGAGLLRALTGSAVLVTAVTVLGTGAYVVLTGSGGSPNAFSWPDYLASLSAARESAATYVAPVPASAPGVHPLLVLGGAVALVAFDLLVCTLRRVAAGALVLLAVATLPIAVTDVGSPWWVFVVAALGFLLLLGLDHAQDMRDWGRELGGVSAARDESDRSSWSGPAGAPGGPRAGAGHAPGRSRPRRFRVFGRGWVRSGSGIALLSVAVAVLVPLAVPTLDLALFAGSARGSGDQEVEVVNPVADMRRDLVRGKDRPVLQLSTSDPDPSYLRLSVLTNFNGEAWTPGDRSIPQDQAANGNLPYAKDVTTATEQSTYDYLVRIDPDFRSQWLPTMAWPRSLTAGGTWRYDRDTMDVMSADDDVSTAGVSYRMRAGKVTHDPEALDRAGGGMSYVARRYSDVPPGLPRMVGDLAREVTARAETPFRKARALQAWFRDPDEFTYTLDHPPLGGGYDTLTSFLGDGPEGRRGYCEQFASAMAVMARQVGIPSRVVVGLLQPEAIASKGQATTYEYSTHDMHAWPELYFPKLGWVAFEPTPSTRASGVPDYTRGQLGNDDGPSPSASASAAPEVPQAPVVPQTPNTPEGESQDAGDVANAALWWWLGLGVVVLGAVAWVPRLVRARRRRRREAAGDVESTWREVQDLCVDLGHRWPSGRSPREVGRWLLGRVGPHHTDGQVGQEVESLVHGLELLRYAPPGAPRPEVGAPVQLQDALVASATPSGVRRARWLPRSVLSRRP